MAHYQAALNPCCCRRRGTPPTARVREKPTGLKPAFAIQSFTRPAGVFGERRVPVGLQNKADERATVARAMLKRANQARGHKVRCSLPS
jgi:hypothetical protein